MPIDLANGRESGEVDVVALAHEGSSPGLSEVKLGKVVELGGKFRVMKNHDLNDPLAHTHTSGVNRERNT